MTLISLLWSCGILDTGLSEQISDEDSSYYPPVFIPLSTYHLTEEQPFELLLEADGRQPLTYGVVTLPENATIDPDMGRFSWTPLLGESLLSPYVIQFYVNDGTEVSFSTGTFFIDAAQPYIHEVIPYRVANSESSEITVLGSGFSPISSLLINGFPVENPQLISETEIRCEVPQMPEIFGPVPLSITFTYNSATSLNALFLYRTDFDFQSPGIEVIEMDTIGQWTPVDYYPDGPDEIIHADNENIWLSEIDIEAGSISNPHLPGTVTELIQGHFESDPGEEFAFIDLYGSVWMDPGPENDDIILVHSALSPATHLTGFDLEGDGDDELVIIDESGDLWLYASLNSGGFSTPIITPEFSSDIDSIDSLFIDYDFVTHLVVKGTAGLGLAPVYETGVAGEMELILESQGFEQPSAAWLVDETRAQLLSLREQEVGLFTFDEGAETWLFSSYINVDTPLTGHSHLIDIDQNGINELYTVSDEWPIVMIHQLLDNEYEIIQWLALGELSLSAPLIGYWPDESNNTLFTTDLSESAIYSIQPHAVQPYLNGPLALYSGNGKDLYFGDITLDGKGDIVVLGATLDNIPVQLHFRGGTDGLYNPTPTVLPSDANFIFEALIDLTGDFMPDVVGLTEDGLMTCFPSRGIGVYETPVITDFGQSAQYLTPINRPYEQGHVIIHHDNGQSVWATFDQQCVLESQEIIAEDGLQFWAEDIDNDGFEDLLLYRSDGLVSTYAFRSLPQLIWERVFPFSSLSALSTGDYNGDLITDLAVISGDELFITYNILDEDSIVFESFDEFQSAVGRELISADFNGDGIDELVTTGGHEPIRVYRFDETEDIMNFPYWTLTASSPMIGDVDNDADLDLIVLIDGFGPMIWTTVPSEPHN